jgi:hypothetical protein
MKWMLFLLLMSCLTNGILLFWVISLMREIKFFRKDSGNWHRRAMELKDQLDNRLSVVPETLMQRLRDQEKEIQDQVALILGQDHMIVGQKASISRLINENRMLLAGRKRYK